MGRRRAVVGGPIDFSFEETSPHRRQLAFQGNVSAITPQVFTIDEDGQYAVYFDNRGRYFAKSVTLVIGIRVPRTVLTGSGTYY